MDTSIKCDEILFDVLKDCKTLPCFLDAVFGFLKRRTDFYVIASQPKFEVGLPPNYAEKLVQHTFHKWQEDSLRLKSVSPPPVLGKSKVNLNSSKTSTCSTPTVAGCYNGAIRDKYMWSQSINELVITIDLPRNISPSELNVLIKTQHISIKSKYSEDIILDAATPHKIKHTNAIWSVDQDSRKIEIHVDKVQEMWWEKLFVDEEALDIDKLDCSRPFEELSQEAQAKIEELQWIENKKRNGLHTPEEERIQTILQNSWHVEGSPFTGSFDPSIVDFSQQ